MGRISYAGEHYFVTTRIIDREPVFLNPVAAGIVMRAVEWMESRKRWEWKCFVVMPDHVHLVIRLPDERTLDRVMNSFKGFTGKRINDTLRRRGPVWQTAYFDHRIRTLEKLEQVAFYCLRNPLHAELVMGVEDWPFFRCKNDLWSQVKGKYRKLLDLEEQTKLWRPVKAGG
jgi:REP element-mobilizing transposase RayT